MNKRFFYDTTFGRLFNTTKTVAGLREFIVMNDISRFPKIVSSDPHSVTPLILTGSPVSDVPSFNHPVYFTGGDRKEYLAIDVRSFTRDAKTTDRDTLDGARVVSKTIDYELAITRLLLNIEFAFGNEQAVRELASFPAIVFAQLLANRLRQTYMLDPEQHQKAQVAIYVYYQRLFFNELDESTIRRIAGNCMSATLLPAVVVMAVTDHLADIEDNYEGLITLLRLSVGDSLGRLNPMVLLNTISSMWIGYAAKELIGGALEHPPTLIAMIYTALTNRSIKDAPLADTATKIKSKYNGDKFMEGVKRLLEAHQPPEEERMVMIRQTPKVNPVF